MLLVQAMDIILRQAPDSFQSHVLSQLLDNILAPAESMAILEQVCRFGVRLFLAGPALAVPLCFRPLPLPPHLLPHAQGALPPGVLRCERAVPGAPQAWKIAASVGDGCLGSHSGASSWSPRRKEPQPRTSGRRVLHNSARRYHQWRPCSCDPAAATQEQP